MRTDPAIIDACHRAFVSVKLHSAPGVWCSPELVRAVVDAFCAANGQKVWHAFTPEGLTAPSDYSGHLRCQFGRWYAEVEDVALDGSKWTAYVVDDTDPDAEWLAVPGSPFFTRDAACEFAEIYMENLNENPDLYRSVLAGQPAGDGVEHGEGPEQPQGLIESEGGTREYLTRGT